MSAPDSGVWIGRIATPFEFEIFTVVHFKVSVFWGVTVHCWVNDCQHSFQILEVTDPIMLRHIPHDKNHLFPLHI